MNFLYGALFLVSIILILLAVHFYNKTEKLLQSGIKTKAEVTGLITVSDSDGDTYKPVFTYLHKSGEKKTHVSLISSSPPAYRVGDTVCIVYDAIDADKVKTITFWGLYRWTILLLCFAAPLLIIGGGYLYFIKFHMG